MQQGMRRLPFTLVFPQDLPAPWLQGGTQLCSAAPSQWYLGVFCAPPAPDLCDGGSGMNCAAVALVVLGLRLCRKAVVGLGFFCVCVVCFFFLDFWCSFAFGSVFTPCKAVKAAAG